MRLFSCSCRGLQQMTKFQLTYTASSGSSAIAEFLADVNLRSRSLYAIARPSVCLSVTLVHPTQLAAIFGNFFYRTIAQAL